MSRYDLSPSYQSFIHEFQGYALVEYETMAEAQAAIDSASGSNLLEQAVQCDYAFVRPPPSGPRKGRGGRDRSASPRRKD